MIDMLHISPEQLDEIIKEIITGTDVPKESSANLSNEWLLIQRHSTKMGL